MTNIEQVEEAVDQLQQVGITTVLRSRKELSDTNPVELSLNDSRNKLIISVAKYYEEDISANLTFKVQDTSKEFRQAVLFVKEGKRTIKRTVTIHLDRKTKIRSDSSSVWRREFPVALPEGKSKFTARYVSVVEDIDYRCWVHSVEITAEVEATSTYFLLGFDEEHMFVSMLPRKAKTVVGAHTMLMPPALRKRTDVIRQGEFYFVPVSDEEGDKITRFIKALLKQGADEMYLLSSEQLTKDKVESDHTAQCSYRTKAAQYVMGAVGNERHYTMLPGWHRVYQNLEVPAPDDAYTWD